MGCIQSFPQQTVLPAMQSTGPVPDILPPVWKESSRTTTTTTDNATALNCPLRINFGVGRIPARYYYHTLTTSAIGNDKLTLEAQGGPFVLSINNRILAVSGKKDFRICRPVPCYEGQAPTLGHTYLKDGKKEKLLLYPYAKAVHNITGQKHTGVLPADERWVKFCHQGKDVNPSLYMLRNPEKNSFEWYLCNKKSLEDNDALKLVTWKYLKAQQLYSITIHEPGCDVGLVLILIVMGGFMDTDQVTASVVPAAA